MVLNTTVFILKQQDHINLSKDDTEEQKKIKFHQFCITPAVYEVNYIEYAANVQKEAITKQSIYERSIVSLLTITDKDKAMVDSNTQNPYKTLQKVMPENEKLHEILSIILQDLTYIQKYSNMFLFSLKIENEISDENICFFKESCEIINIKLNLLEEYYNLFDENISGIVKILLIHTRKDIMQYKFNFLNHILSKKFVNFEENSNFISIFNQYKNECFPILFDNIEETKVSPTRAYKMLNFFINSCILDYKLTDSFNLLEQFRQNKDKINKLLVILEKDFLKTLDCELNKLHLVILMYSTSILLENYDICKKFTEYCMSSVVLRNIVLQDSGLSHQDFKIKKPIVVYENIKHIIIQMIEYKNQDPKFLKNLTSYFIKIQNFYRLLLENAFNYYNNYTIFNNPIELYAELFNEENINKTTVFIYDLYRVTEHLNKLDNIINEADIKPLKTISSIIDLEKTSNKVQLKALLTKIEKIDVTNARDYIKDISIFIIECNIKLLLLNYQQIVCIHERITQCHESLGDISILKLPDNSLSEIIEQKHNLEKSNYIINQLNKFWISDLENNSPRNKQVMAVIPTTDKDYDYFIIKEQQSIDSLKYFFDMLSEFIQYSNGYLTETDGELQFKLPIKIALDLGKANKLYIDLQYSAQVSLQNKVDRYNICLLTKYRLLYIISNVLLSGLLNYNVKLTQNFLSFSVTDVIEIILSLEREQFTFSYLLHSFSRILATLYMRHFFTDCSFSHDFYNKIQQEPYKSRLDKELATYYSEAMTHNNFNLLLDLITVYALSNRYTEVNQILINYVKYKVSIADDVCLRIGVRSQIFTNDFIVSINYVETIFDHVIKQYNKAKKLQSIAGLKKECNGIDEIIEVFSKLTEILEDRFNYEKSYLQKLLKTDLSQINITAEESKAIKNTANSEKKAYLQALNIQYKRICYYENTKNIKKIYFDRIEIPVSLQSIPSLSINIADYLPADLSIISEDSISNMLEKITHVYLKVSNNIKHIDTKIKILKNKTADLKKIKSFLSNKLLDEIVKQIDNPIIGAKVSQTKVKTVVVGASCETQDKPESNTSKSSKKKKNKIKVADSDSGDKQAVTAESSIAVAESATQDKLNANPKKETPQKKKDTIEKETTITPQNLSDKQAVTAELSIAVGTSETQDKPNANTSKKSKKKKNKTKVADSDSSDKQAVTAELSIAVTKLETTDNPNTNTSKKSKKKKNKTKVADSDSSDKQAVTAELSIDAGTLETQDKPNANPKKETSQKKKGTIEKETTITPLVSSNNQVVRAELSRDVTKLETTDNPKTNTKKEIPEKKKNKTKVAEKTLPDTTPKKEKPQKKKDAIKKSGATIQKPSDNQTKQDTLQSSKNKQGDNSIKGKESPTKVNPIPVSAKLGQLDLSATKSNNQNNSQKVAPAKQRELKITDSDNSTKSKVSFVMGNYDNEFPIINPTSVTTIDKEQKGYKHSKARIRSNVSNTKKEKITSGDDLIQLLETIEKLYDHVVEVRVYSNFNSYINRVKDQEEDLNDICLPIIQKQYVLYSSTTSQITVLITAKKETEVQQQKFIQPPISFMALADFCYNYLAQQAFTGYYSDIQEKIAAISKCWEFVDKDDLMKFSKIDTDRYYYLNKIIVDVKYNFQQKEKILSCYWHDKYHENLIYNFIKRLEADNDYETKDKKEMLYMYWHYIDNVYEAEKGKTISLDTYLNSIILNSLYTDQEKIQKLDIYFNNDLLFNLADNNVNYIFHYFSRIILDDKLKFDEKVRILTFYKTFIDGEVSSVANIFIINLYINSVFKVFQNPVSIENNAHIVRKDTNDIDNHTLFMLIDFILGHKEKGIEITIANLLPEEIFSFQAAAIMHAVIELIDKIEAIKNYFESLSTNEYDILQSTFNIFGDKIDEIYAIIDQMINVAEKSYQDAIYAYEHSEDKRPKNNLINIQPFKPRKYLLSLLHEIKDIFKN